MQRLPDIVCTEQQLGPANFRPGGDPGAIRLRNLQQGGSIPAELNRR